MRAEAWQAVAYLVLASAAIVGGIWALFTHRRTRRIDAAKWVNDLFVTFYRDPKMLQARDVFEYEYWSTIRQAVELRVTDRHVPLSLEQRRIITDLDLVLNVLEQLVYLERETHIRTRDREVFFDYWFCLLRYPCRAGMRRYLINCGFERCAEVISVEESDYVVLPTRVGDGHPQLRLVGTGYLPLCEDTQGHSGLDRTATPHAVSVFLVGDRSIFRTLDRGFGYDSSAPQGSKVRRVCLPLIDGSRDVWTYLDSNDLDTLPLMLPEAGGGYHSLL